MPCSYLISNFDPHLAVAYDIDGAAAAYSNARINTVLMTSPLAGAFNDSVRGLKAEEIDQCADFLEYLHPSEYPPFASLTAGQQDFIFDVKDKESILADVFHAVVGGGAYIDASKYVPTRRGVMRTAIPHIDECDTHMTATLIGRRGTLLYRQDFSDVNEADFKMRRVIIDPNNVIETDPSQLCFIKGTDHPDIMGEESKMGSRWHSSSIITDLNEARMANFFAMRNGLGACRNYG